MNEQLVAFSPPRVGLIRMTRASHAAPARSSLEALGLDRTTAEDIAKGLNELGPV